MRIQHNIMAMSAYRNYTNNVSAMKKNLEKLSSGYKINRAGDDAAGLAISEKMRAQITGLETAQKNAKDGISLVQTAEGALTEVHDMLNRMVELATMSANGTYDNTTDRAQLQKEMDQLKSEINRIADSSNFNGIKLLDGSMGTAMGKAEQVTVTAVADGSQGGNDAQKGVYTVDLKDLKINLTANAAGLYLTTMAGAALNIGGVTINLANMGSVTAYVEDGIVTGEEIVDFLNTAAGKAALGNAGTTAGAAIGGGGKAQFTAEGSTITMTMLAAPTTTTDIPQNMTVSLTAPTTGSHNNGFDQAVHAETPAAVANPDKLAQGSFDLTKYVVDGGQLTIGDDTYTFKVGKDSMVSGSGGNIIDLSKYDPTDTATLLKAAADALSQAGKSNKLFDVTTNSQGNMIYLTERQGALNYNKDWDLKGGTAATNDGKWNEPVKDGNRKTGVVTFSAPAGTNNSLTLQIGDTADSFNQLKVSINDCHTDALGLDGISIADQASAAKAVDAIKSAINYVSDVRGTLGATQNRLDHTINNLSVMTENIQDAESTIRDVDVAEEMMAYTKNNILIQSAQAMLAQANQVPQGVLQLLQ